MASAGASSNMTFWKWGCPMDEYEPGDAMNLQPHLTSLFHFSCLPSSLKFTYQITLKSLLSFCGGRYLKLTRWVSLGPGFLLLLLSNLSQCLHPSSGDFSAWRPGAHSLQTLAGVKADDAAEANKMLRRRPWGYRRIGQSSFPWRSHHTLEDKINFISCHLSLVTW